MRVKCDPACSEKNVIALTSHVIFPTLSQLVHDRPSCDMGFDKL